jgi:hypothetical protein
MSHTAPFVAPLSPPPTPPCRPPCPCAPPAPRRAPAACRWLPALPRARSTPPSTKRRPRWAGIVLEAKCGWWRGGAARRPPPAPPCGHAPNPASSSSSSLPGRHHRPCRRPGRQARRLLPLLAVRHIPPVRCGARQAQRGDGGQRGAIDHQEGVERESGRQRACGWGARRARPPRAPRLGRPGAGSRAPSVTGDASRSLHALRRASGFSAVPIQPPPFLCSRSTAAARGTRAPARPTASSF